MIPVATAARTRALDAAVIEGLGVPGRQLMELAGHGAAEQIHHRWPHATVAVLCGPGNNGGDGFVIARWLHLWGHRVRLWAPRGATTADARANLDLAARLGLEPQGLEHVLDGAQVGVDALLGTGQQDAPRGFALDGLRALGRLPVRVAIDIPTGVHADTGQVLGTAPPTFDLTIPLGRLKAGLLCPPALQLAGEIALVDIGLNLGRLHDPALATPLAWLLEAADVAAWLPVEDGAAAKWHRGHVAVRAGGGAAVLAAHGAMRAPVGLVTLLAPRADWPALHGLWPEIILAEPNSLDPARHDALVLGPGLGPDAGDEVERLWRDFENPILADADALAVLAERQLSPPPERIRAITPHVAEAGRMLGRSAWQVDADRFAALADLAPFGTALLKGPRTLIGAPGAPWVNPTGSVALATAGSGDVLSGLAGGYLARGLPAAQALALAAWRHGRAGERMGVGGTASELLRALPEAWPERG